MRPALSFALWLAGVAIACAQPPFLSKGWTFDESNGAALYAHVCAACHLANGEGASGAADYPALMGDQRLASTDYVLNVLLAGQHAMPALGRAMSDSQLVDLVNYVRKAFGGEDSDPATKDRVSAARAVLNR